MKHFLKDKKTILIFECFCVFFWLAFLRESDAFYAPYLLTGILGILCLMLNSRSSDLCNFKYNKPGRETKTIEYSIAVLYSLAVSAANYRLYAGLDLSYMAGKTARTALTILSFLVCFFGGFFALLAILRYLRNDGIHGLMKLLFREKSVADPVRTHCHSKAVFWGAAGFFAIAYSLVLFLAKYPGVLTEDSISQLEQILTGVYSNHHPFYHTMLIKLCVSFGWSLFGNWNAAVAVYSVMQILLMSCTFAYLISTLYRMNVNNCVLAVAALWFVGLPCHFMYSFSMWKDIPFAAALTVFLVTLYRKLNKIGRRSVWNCLLLSVSALGVCLLRSNGWAIFLASFLCFVLFFGKRQRKLCILFFAVLITSFVLKHPVLNTLGVSTTDTVEALSIPVQQVARVIDECKDSLTDEQRSLLDQIVDVDRVPIYYSEFISNPIKELVRETDHQEYLRTHALDYLKLYLTLGVSYPRQYFEAYVEQTKGYWNSGYNYWVTTDMVAENSLGIEKSVVSKTFNSLIEQYVYLFSSSDFFALFQSIGFHVWLTVLAGYVAFCRRDKSAFFLTVPLVMNLFSLLIATPVFAEFRYTYSLFCVFPFVVISPFYKKEVRPNG